MGEHEEAATVRARPPVIKAAERSDEYDAGLCGYCAHESYAGRPCGCRCHETGLAHEQIVVEGEIEVCAGCRNSQGYNVAWEFAHPERGAR